MVRCSGPRLSAGGSKPQSALAKQGQLLRVRIESEDSGRSREASGGFLRAVLTYKGPALEEVAARPVSAGSPSAANPPPPSPLGEASQFVPVGRHKVREEIEVEVAEPTALTHILEALGM